MPDKIKITVTPEGIIKTETDKVSAVNHANAEAFIKHLATMAGGKVEKKLRTGHTHAHEQDHTHDHEESHDHTH